MQASSSLLDRIFPPSSPLLPQHDRPRSHSQSPSSPARSPPAVHSSVVPTTSWSSPKTSHSDPFLSIDRATRSLQRTVQSLLDAQSEALLASLPSSEPEQDVQPDDLPNLPSIGSSSSIRPHHPAVVPIRQPQKEKLSIQGARRGLCRAMQDFIALKHDEEAIVDGQIHQRTGALDRVDTFESKRIRLQSEIDSICAKTGTQSVSHLRSEASKLDTHIRATEEKLWEMKARRRQLGEHVQQLDNSVQAQRSSYDASLALLDKQIYQFLARPPTTAYTGPSQEPESTEESIAPATFYDLAPQRRTLGMASEKWHGECEALQNRKSSIIVDRAALEAGGQLWTRVVAEIQSCEQHVKSEMEKLSSTSISQGEKDDGMVKVLEMVNGMIEELEQSTREAEGKDWKLLICGLGAELAALKEGRQILVDASSHLEGRDEAHHVGPNNLIDDQPATDQTAAVAFWRQPDLDPHADATRRSQDTEIGISLPPHSLSNTQQVSPPGEPQDSTRTNSGNENISNLGTSPTSATVGSEDDDPGPDFLISHS